MNPLWIALSAIGFILAQAGAAVLFKAMVSQEGLRWWLFFAAGNAVGFGCPVALSIALRGTNANLIYAICYGGGFCLVQLATWLIFRDPLSAWQWTGVGFVLFGLILLQFR